MDENKKKKEGIEETKKVFEIGMKLKVPEDGNTKGIFIGLKDQVENKGK